jgi:NADH-quinone oxidoreductase subunit N
VGGLGDENHDVSAYKGLGTVQYKGLARRQPLLAGAFVILLLSQLGAPGTTGFYAKFAVLEAAIEQHGPIISLIAIVSAAIAAFFYLRWCLVMFSSDEASTSRVAVPRASAAVIFFAVAVTLVFGIWPGPLASLAQHAGLLFTP